MRAAGLQVEGIQPNAIAFGHTGDLEAIEDGSTRGRFHQLQPQRHRDDGVRADFCRGFRTRPLADSEGTEAWTTEKALATRPRLVTNDLGRERDQMGTVATENAGAPHGEVARHRSKPVGGADAPAKVGKQVRTGRELDQGIALDAVDSKGERPATQERISRLNDEGRPLSRDGGAPERMLQPGELVETMMHSGRKVRRHDAGGRRIRVGEPRSMQEQARRHCENA
ncbi:hypothetical protein [Bradyrhizobium japonicum]|uniref:hypothetical protein n=1 Tax=Bradyrhizobium japonicum TaxID=375 RepID=UPI002714B3AB|nr:hypothetical protein [Bradyrhizobium japonicum]WLB23863.1 hypothetical protein QIH95_08900 [Bradyrhizobium japonicum]